MMVIWTRRKYLGGANKSKKKNEVSKTNETKSKSGDERGVEEKVLKRKKDDNDAEKQHDNDAEEGYLSGARKLSDDDDDPGQPWSFGKKFQLYVVD